MRTLGTFQRDLLRGWAINMTFVASVSDARRLGFDYTAAEMARFREMARDFGGSPRIAWLVLSVVFYLLVELPLLVLAFTALAFLPFALLLCLIIVISILALPTAMGLAAAGVAALLRIPSFEQADADAELYSKVRWQVLFTGMVAVIAALAIGGVAAIWNARQ
jgi:hypothetical protein